MSKRRFHITNDPVHGTMQFEKTEWQWIKPFLDSEPVQRLRHVRQLGFTDLLFPGAVHTRFNHSLGCCYVGNQIANLLELPEKSRQIVSIACLLHDIGHGPFSHAFEELFWDKAVCHEDWTPLFLKEYASEAFLTAYSAKNPDATLDEADLSLITSLICHKPTPHRLLADIVSSQLDADRLDYLLRDSHFCGVNYGRYDFRWLLHCLTIVSVGDEQRLGIGAKGVGAVEQYLMARRLMTQNIYHHHRKHAGEFLLKAFLRAFADDMAQGLVSEAMQANPLGQFLKEASVFNQLLQKTQDREKIVDEFKSKNFSVYSKLCDYDVLDAIRYCAKRDRTTPAVEIAKRLYYRRLPRVYRVFASQAASLQASVKEALGSAELNLQAWQLAILSSPHKAYSGQQDPIYVQESQGLRYLHDDSLMIGALSDKQETSCFLCVDAEILELPAVAALVKDLQSMKIEEDVEF